MGPKLIIVLSMIVFGGIFGYIAYKLKLNQKIWGRFIGRFGEKVAAFIWIVIVIIIQVGVNQLNEQVITHETLGKIIQGFSWGLSLAFIPTTGQFKPKPRNQKGNDQDVDDHQ